MDALKLMREDHDKLKKLLERAEHAQAEGNRENLLDKIRAELKPHERMEEEVFYPALKDHKKAKDIVLEGYQEHHVADVVFAELEETPVGSDIWKAKMKVLKEGLEHHIEDEEGEMFKKARAVFDKSELDELGERMQAVKDRM
jgi:hemerythrin-like domain-containing protein